MRYIDSGGRQPAEALGSWLDVAVVRDVSVSGLRWQSGFFGAQALGYFSDAMSRLHASDGIVHALVGSNDGMTTRADIEALLAVAGPPRTNRRIGIVHFENANFHPKTVHVSRFDGSAAAYVGSANLTGSGVTSLNIEAGVLLDSREGDDPELLGRIAAAIDWWFAEPRDGLSVVTMIEQLDELVGAGILNVPRPVVPRSSLPSNGERGPRQPRLAPLVTAPPLPPGIAPVPGPIVIATPPEPPVVLPAATAAPPTTRAVWGKALTRSDAQRKQGGNQRGSITLVKGDYDIDAQRYFRFDFFGTALWAAGTTRTGEPLEIARIPFSVTFLGADMGVLEFEVTYAQNREAAQANYTSLLHLGPLSAEFVRRDLEGRRLEVVREATGTYSLSIS